MLKPHVRSTDLLCEAHAYLGQLEEALKICDDCVTLKSPSALDRLLGLLINSGEVKQATKILETHCKV